jgi:hypothetical protein
MPRSAHQVLIGRPVFAGLRRGGLVDLPLFRPHKSQVATDGASAIRRRWWLPVIAGHCCCVVPPDITEQPGTGLWAYAPGLPAAAVNVVHGLMCSEDLRPHAEQMQSTRSAPHLLVPGDIENRGNITEECTFL